MKVLYVSKNCHIAGDSKQFLKEIYHNMIDNVIEVSSEGQFLNEKDYECDFVNHVINYFVMYTISFTFGRGYTVL